MISEQIKEEYLKRINDILKKLENSYTTDSSSNVRRYVRSRITECFVGTMSIVHDLYRNSNEKYTILFNLKTKLSDKFTSEFGTVVGIVVGILNSIKTDIEKDYLHSIVNMASGEVLGDMIYLSREALREDHVNVAAVLAAASFEDAIKRRAQQIGINTDDKKLDTIVNEMKKNGHFGGSQKDMVKSYVRFRNDALHADWDKIDNSQTSSLIGFLEMFLIEHFS